MTVPEYLRDVRGGHPAFRAAYALGVILDRRHTHGRTRTVTLRKPRVPLSWFSLRG